MCSFERVGNETTHEESGFDRASEFFSVGTGVAVEGGKAARPRPCDWEPLTPLATVPAALVLAGSACAAMAVPAKNARTQGRGFAKSEHMTPSSVSSALVEWTLHDPLIILPG